MCPRCFGGVICGSCVNVRVWPNCAGRAGGAAAPHSGHLNRGASAMGFRLRPAPIGHFLTSARSEAGAGYDRIQDGADAAPRHARHARVPEAVEVQAHGESMPDQARERTVQHPVHAEGAKLADARGSFS